MNFMCYILCYWALSFKFCTKKILPLEATPRTYTELNPWNMILGGGHLGVGLPKSSVIIVWET